MCGVGIYYTPMVYAHNFNIAVIIMHHLSTELTKLTKSNYNKESTYAFAFTLHQLLNITKLFVWALFCETSNLIRIWNMDDVPTNKQLFTMTSTDVFWWSIILVPPSFWIFQYLNVSIVLYVVGAIASIAFGSLSWISLRYVSH